MKNGKCPKCNSSNVFKNENGLYWGEHLWVDVWFGTFREGSNEQSNCDVYICTDCGYFEHYLLDKDVLQKVRSQWTRVA